MNAGGVIAYRDKREVSLGLIRRDDGKTLRIVNEKGKEFPYPKARVALVVGGNHDARMAAADVRDLLKEVRTQALTARDEVDLELLWATVREDSENGGPLEQLADLYFGADSSAIQKLALLEALETDSAYFKRKGGDIVPKDEAAVQETLRQQLEAAQRESQRLAALAWLRDALERGDGLGEDAPAGVADLVERLKQVAVLGEESPAWTEAQGLFKDLGRGGPEAAFDVLVDLGEFSRDENLSIHAYDVEVEFPEAIREEAARLAEAGPAEEPREDLRGLETLSIDDAETTEVDDALSLEPGEDGGVRLWVHIADAAAFVPRGGAVDLSARRRATTIYTPDRTIPMIPEAISMGSCSLITREDRPALSVRIDLDAEGKVLARAFVPSLIMIDQAFTYEDADEGITQPGLLQDLHAVSVRLRAVREAAGAQSFERQELRVKVDGEGHIEVRKVVGDCPSQILVSEMMVLANRCAGEVLQEAKLPALYKRQAKPQGDQGNFIPKSSMGLEPGEHFGLGMPVYCQMTSPIRRYSDLAAHRQLGVLLGRPREGHDEAELGAVLATCQEREQAARAVQKEGKRYWTLSYLDRLHHKEVVAVVQAHRRGNMVAVRLEDYVFPCMLPQPQGVSLKEDERVLVKITRVDPRGGMIRLRYIEHLPADVDALLAAAAASAAAPQGLPGA